MKKKKKFPLPKDLQKALDLFPKIVRANRVNYAKRQRFVEKTFGELARKVHQEVYGKKSGRHSSRS